MATVIDALMVTLGLDATAFKKEKDSVDKGLKDTSKKGSDGFTAMTKSATTFFAALGGSYAVKQFIEQQIEANSALDRFSKNLGINANTVSAWGNATELAGGSAQGLQGTMDMLSRSQTELQLTGESGLIPFFSALGLSLTTVAGKAAPVNDILLQLADKFSKMDRTQANNMARMMGIDQGTANLLLRGRSEVEKMIMAQKDYNAVTQVQADQSERLRMGMAGVGQTFAAFGRELLSDAMPSMEKTLKYFDSFGQWCRDNKTFVEAFLTGLSILMGGVALSFTLMTLPITTTTAAITAFIAAMSLLYDDFKKWKGEGDSLINWAAPITAANKALDKFSAGVKAIVPKKMFDAAFGDKEKQAIDYFQKQGWTKEQATGIAANLKRESKFNPSVTGDSGAALGIAQWHGDRQAEFKKKFGHSMRDSTYEEQLEFVNFELTQGNEQRAGGELRKAKSANAAGRIISNYYERPKDRIGEGLKRATSAQEMFNGIAGASEAAAGATGSYSSPTSSKSVTNNIGNIEIHTNATDANGIAKDLGSALDYNLTAQANAGMR